MTIQEVHVPDIGDFADVEVIEVLVAVGDEVKVEDSLITVESDKASMEIPAPISGKVTELRIAPGDKVSKGSLLLLVDTAAATVDAEADQPQSAAPPPTTAPIPGAAASKPVVPVRPSPQANVSADESAKSSPTAHISHESFKKAYATPSVRKFARELGADLSKIKGSGRKGRITQEDVKHHIKELLSFGGNGQRGAPGFTGGSGIPPMPAIDFSQWGQVEERELSRINKLTGEFLHRNWLNIPHVTQFDQADITEMEAFRQALNAEHKQTGAGSKTTPLVFIMKAVVAALKQFPRFNTSLSPEGDKLFQKYYYHIGIAVDTPDGLVVPVIRDVDQKSLTQLSLELQNISVKAREKKLKPGDMQGGCFSISSLGGIGGTKFTPIVNAPEVAILGVSRADMQPVWNGREFAPRLMLPLALSYDHRVIDGADGARFTTYLAKVLGDIRRLLV